MVADMKTSRLALEIACRKTVQATDEAAAIKTEFRREDQALARAGRAREFSKKRGRARYRPARQTPTLAFHQRCALPDLM